VAVCCSWLAVLRGHTLTEFLQIHVTQNKQLRPTLKTFFFSSHLLSMTFPFRIIYAFVCSMLNIPDTQKATHVHHRIIIKCFGGCFTSVSVEVCFHERHEVVGCAESSGGHWVCHCTG